jgi:hypothetical protein
VKPLNDFKKFLFRGNVVDLAVAVGIGAAFTAVVKALVSDLLTPIIAVIFGSPNFGNLSFTINGWIFARDPDFTAKGGPVLDLYSGRWQGELLHPGDYVVCCDEKPSIQARHRKHRTRPATASVERGQRVEHEYQCKGALCYLAAWDARRAKLFDRCASKDGIVPFDALVEQFMSVAPYSKAQRVFVIVDNGSAHRGKKSIDRLQGAWPNLILVHTPVHASWLNQAEIYFSIVQRKVLTPNDFADLDTLQQQLLAFGRRYEQSPPHSNGDPHAPASPNVSSYPPHKPPERIRRRTSEPEH